MIEYFPPGTTVFKGGTLLPKAFEAKITHERNGKFDLEFKYPLVDDRYKDFKKSTIFYVDVPYMKKQAFYLSKIKKMKGYVEVYAKHIFFLLDKNITKDIKSSNVIGSTILERFNNSLQIPHNYTFSSNITESHMFNAEGYQNAMSVLAEGKHSILGQWGGVLVMDNFDIKLQKRFGRDTEFLVAKRKNINDIEIDEDSEDVVTRLFLTRELEDDEGNSEVITTIVDSPLINEYPEIYGEAREVDDEKITNKEELIKYGEDIFRLQRIDLPDESFSIDVTDDVKEYEFTIDDTALIYYEDYDIYKRVMVTSYTYDPIANKYLKVNFGDKPRTMLQATSEKVSNSIEKDIKPSFDYINSMIKDITEQIKDPDGGIIITKKDNLGRPMELLITDNLDLEKAKNIWRWNINGLGHSSNGINGDFNIGITQDGKIVADFIAAGVLNAALIKAGILESLDGSVSINMESGKFKIGNTAEHTENYSKYLHQDGSYTEISAKGLYRYDSGVGREYHHMTKIIKFSAGSDGQAPSNKWIPLGKEFNNKKWSVALSISDSMGASSNEATIHRIVLTQGHDSNNKPVQPRFRNGQWEYPVMGYKTNYNCKNDSRRYGPVAGIMIITA